MLLSIDFSLKIPLTAAANFAQFLQRENFSLPILFIHAQSGRKLSYIVWLFERPELAWPWPAVRVVSFESVVSRFCHHKVEATFSTNTHIFSPSMLALTAFQMHYRISWSDTWQPSFIVKPSATQLMKPDVIDVWYIFKQIDITRIILDSFNVLSPIVINRVTSWTGNENNMQFSGLNFREDSGR